MLLAGYTDVFPAPAIDTRIEEVDFDWSDDVSGIRSPGWHYQHKGE